MEMIQLERFGELGLSGTAVTEAANVALHRGSTPGAENSTLAALLSKDIKQDSEERKVYSCFWRDCSCVCVYVLVQRMEFAAFCWGQLKSEQAS